MNENLQIAAALSAATEQLRPASESARLDAELLLARALDVPRSYLFAHPEETMDAAAAARFEANVRRRQDVVPLAYITGEKEFWSMPLMVSPATLVPRPETELLVRQALGLIPEDAASRVLDLGTGCGTIALALAKERRNCQVTATDCSAEALAVARQNARQLGLANIEFVQGDWLEPIAEREFDLVVSNPPYVPGGDPDLQRLRHEPLLALASGDDGLDAIRLIATAAPQVLCADRHLLLEHGDRQRDEVAGLLQAAGWREIHCCTDLGGLPRVTMARRPGGTRG